MISKVRTNWRRLWCDFEDNFLSDIIESWYAVCCCCCCWSCYCFPRAAYNWVPVLLVCNKQRWYWSRRRRRRRFCCSPPWMHKSKFDLISCVPFVAWVFHLTLAHSKFCSYDYWISAHTNRTCVSRTIMVIHVSHMNIQKKKNKPPSRWRRMEGNRFHAFH